MQHPVFVPCNLHKILFLVLGFSLIACEAQAISRYNSTSMNCSQIRATIQAEGAVIMRWRSAQDATRPLFKRLVAHNGYCDRNERAETVFIPSADQRSCAVRECKRYDPDDDMLFRLWRRR